MYDPLCTHLAAAGRARSWSASTTGWRRSTGRRPRPSTASTPRAGWLPRAPSCGPTPAGSRVCGDSAGGNLAAVVAQVAARPGRLAGPPPGADLPGDRHDAGVAVDRRATPTRRCSPGRDRGLPRALRPEPARTGETRSCHRCSATSTGLPPALVQTADLDPLRDDGDALRRARCGPRGCAVRLTNYLRVPHGFASIPGMVAAGAQHRAELVGELRRHLYAADAPERRPAG